MRTFNYVTFHERSWKLLESNNISRIVNCTHNIENYFPGKCQYYNIAIGKWRQHHDESDPHLLWAFLLPYLQFVEGQLDSGHNVLLHCLAGAHRAGTAAVLAVMFLTGMDSKQVKIDTNLQCILCTLIGFFTIRKKKLHY